MNERRGKRRLDFSLQAYFLDGKVFVSKMEDASTQNSTQNSTLCIIYQCLCETMSMSVHCLKNLYSKMDNCGLRYALKFKK